MGGQSTAEESGNDGSPGKLDVAGLPAFLFFDNVRSQRVALTGLKLVVWTRLDSHSSTCAVFPSMGLRECNTT